MRSKLNWLLWNGHPMARTFCSALWTGRHEFFVALSRCMSHVEKNSGHDEKLSPPCTCHRCMSTTMKGFIPTRFQSTVCHGLFFSDVWTAIGLHLGLLVLVVPFFLVRKHSFGFLKWQVWIVVPKGQWPLPALTGLQGQMVQTIRRKNFNGMTVWNPSLW